MEKVLSNWIVLEGPDGVGKTTRANFFESLGVKAMYLSAPSNIPEWERASSMANTYIDAGKDIEKDKNSLYVTDRSIVSSLVYATDEPYVANMMLGNYLRKGGLFPYLLLIFLKQYEKEPRYELLRDKYLRIVDLLKKKRSLSSMSILVEK